MADMNSIVTDINIQHWAITQYHGDHVKTYMEIFSATHFKLVKEVISHMGTYTLIT